MKGIYFQMNPEMKDSAITVFRFIRDKYKSTPWGIECARILNNRLTIEDKDIERLRKRVKNSEEHIDKLSAQYYENLSKKPEEKKVEVKSKEEEILENTYNSMYDFE